LAGETPVLKAFSIKKGVSEVCSVEVVEDLV
jgi:hypothetical protein